MLTMQKLPRPTAQFVSKGDTVVLPLIPLIIIAGTIVSGSGGAAVGIWGGSQIKQAKADIKAQAAEYESQHALHLATVDWTNVIFRKLGNTQERAQHEAIYRMKNFLERHAKQVRTHEHLILDGIDGVDQHVVGLTKLDADLAGWVRGVVGSTILGVATPIAIRTGVMTLATASTGTAIAGLGGAAATSATMAWLGGGVLTVGGGGMALGAVMLDVAIVGPTVLVAGITIKNRGTKAKTEADKNQTSTKVAIAELHARNEVLRAVQLRATEINLILTRLLAEATVALDLLESEPFVMERHAGRLQTSLILVKSVRDVATAPIADESGSPDERSEELMLKYRESSKETPHE